MNGDGMLPVFSLWNSHFCRKMVLVQVIITSCLDSAQCLLTGLFASTFSPSDSVLVSIARLFVLKHGSKYVASY